MSSGLCINNSLQAAFDSVMLIMLKLELNLKCTPTLLHIQLQSNATKWSPTRGRDWPQIMLHSYIQLYFIVNNL